MMSVSVTTGATFTLAERRPIVAGESVDNAMHANYDVAPDGQLLILRRSGGDVTAVLVHNWGRVLREKLGLEKR